MIINKSRIEREQITVAAMIRLYCRLNHAESSLCPDCAHIMDYAMGRLDKCPYRDEKPTCVSCPIHCYKADEREKIREIMRFSGPRMIWSHPVLAIIHLIDNRKKKKAPALKKNRTNAKIKL